MDWQSLVVLSLKRSMRYSSRAVAILVVMDL